MDNTGSNKSELKVRKKTPEDHEATENPHANSVDGAQPDMQIDPNTGDKRKPKNS